MIVKSIPHTRASYKRLLNYIFKESDTIKPLVQTNVQGSTVPQWIDEFKENEKSRLYIRNNNTKIFHEVLSFSKDDYHAISKNVMKDIGMKYLQMRGENIIGLGAIHTDRKNVHLHLMLSPVELFTGRSIRISKQRFEDIKLELQKYHLQKYPDIKHSTVEHGKKELRISEKEYQLKKRKNKTEKELTKELLEQLYKKSYSKEDFYSLIQKNSLVIYERNGKPYGIIGKRKMRFSTFGFDYEKIERLNIVKEFEKIRSKETDNQSLGLER